MGQEINRRQQAIAQKPHEVQYITKAADNMNRQIISGGKMPSCARCQDAHLAFPLGAAACTQTFLKSNAVHSVCLPRLLTGYTFSNTYVHRRHTNVWVKHLAHLASFKSTIAAEALSIALALISAIGDEWLCCVMNKGGCVCHLSALDAPMHLNMMLSGYAAPGH
jgi:hypothetical protein